MECKDIFSMSASSLTIINWNISRMECKVYCLNILSLTAFNWNISRMECKVYKRAGTKASIRIGIYPEWNVKIDLKMKSVQNPPIGIYPEWNVKLS